MQFYKQADGIIVAFDVTNRQSFKNVRTWITTIYKQLGNVQIPKILVGNKTDLRETLSQEEVVSTEEAKLLADEHKMEYYEVSAFAESGIEEMMGAIIQQVYDYKLRPQI